MNDRTNAEALRQARAHLEKMGYKYSAVDIGKLARDIIEAMKGKKDE